MSTDVTHLYAWLMLDEDGNEAVPALCDDLGVWRPMMGPDRQQMLDLEGMAMQTARMAGHGHPIQLVSFERQRLVRTLEP